MLQSGRSIAVHRGLSFCLKCRDTVLFHGKSLSRQCIDLDSKTKAAVEFDLSNNHLITSMRFLGYMALVVCTLNADLWSH
jgi:hypothetical protein